MMSVNGGDEKMRGAVIAMVVGIICVVAGVVLVVVCWEQFKVMFLGAIGPVILLGGLLLAAIGWSEYEAAKQWQEATSAAIQSKPVEAQPSLEPQKEAEPKQPAQQPTEQREATQPQGD